MSKEVIDILERIGNERNISVEILFEALEQAMVSAAKKILPLKMNVVRAELNRETGEFRIYATKWVVNDIDDEECEITLQEAKKIYPDAKLDTEIEVEVTPPQDEFGRIAAQSAKQVINQRLREAERKVIYEKFKNKLEDLVSGTVIRYEKGNAVIDLGICEGIIPYEEQAYGERYYPGDKLRAVIVSVCDVSRDSQLILSRKSPKLVLRLFEQEVPEITDRIVTIKLVAREAGKRAKIAVASSDTNVDPVGACVGMKGSRVQMVVQELRGERIDIVEYSDDKTRFVANALKPAEVESVQLNDDHSRALVVVKEGQLSLAFGKNRLNVKLASDLTKIDIDVIALEELLGRENKAKEALKQVPGIGDITVGSMIAHGFFSLEDIVEKGAKALEEVEGIGAAKSKEIYKEAQTLLSAKKSANNDSRQNEVSVQQEVQSTDVTSG